MKEETGTADANREIESAEDTETSLLELVAESETKAAPEVPPGVWPTLSTARVHGYDPETGRVELLVGEHIIEGRRDEKLHQLVLETAAQRQEVVVVERPASGPPVVLGPLRTQPTPGVEHADEYTIAADRVHIEATEEITLAAQTASLALRALGEVETYADRIISRAEDVQKIVGRMLRLN